MSDALERIQERVRTAAMVPPPEQTPPVNTPAEPNTPAPADQRLTDLETTVSDLAARVAEIEQAEIEDAIAEMDDMGAPGNVAALPEHAVGEPANA